MKKVLLSVAVVATFGLGMTSCGGIDVDAASKEFCECKDSEDANKCYDGWVEKYADAKASDEDSEKLAASMLACDMNGVIYVGSKIEE